MAERETGLSGRRQAKGADDRDVMSFILALPLCGVLDVASFKFAYNGVLP